MMTFIFGMWFGIALTYLCFEMAKLKQKNGYGITSDMKQEPVDKTAKQRHEENT